MKNIGQMMKQAQQMQAKMAEFQASLDQMEATGAAGGGMVQVTLDGKNTLKSLKIDKTIVDPEDVEMLEDLIKAAFNDARGKIESIMQVEMEKMTGGLKLPGGMKLPF